MSRAPFTGREVGTFTDDAVDAHRERTGGWAPPGGGFIRIACSNAVTRRPGTCVHCSRPTQNPTGLICHECFDADVRHRAIVDRLLAVACPSCEAPTFADCRGAASGFHAARIVKALKAVRA